MSERRLIEGVVANLRLFREAEPARVAAVARQSWLVAAKRGDGIACRGERLPGVFAVAYGLVKIALRAAAGAERVLRLAGAGEIFGAAPALLGRIAPYDALALAETKLVVIPTAPILALVEHEPRFGNAVSRMLAERTLELLAELEAATLQDGAQRLAAYLGALAERSNGGSVRLPVTKTVVAARLGMKKETLSRLLRRFAAEGVIEVTRGEIAILDRQRLGVKA